MITNKKGIQQKTNLIEAALNCPVPFPRSYWVIPGRLLAGELPCAKDAREAKKKLDRLLDAGVRRTINLMQPDETDHLGHSFTPYEPILAELARDRGVTILSERFPIKDFGIPSAGQMINILDFIDDALIKEEPLYVHCWGGIGRTGTVVGCFLMRHELGNAGSVMDVIRRLRQNEAAAHRTSPETPEQQTWVRSWRQFDPTSPGRNFNINMSRFYANDE